MDTYRDCDIYNLDETGLFWQLMPDKTLGFKGQKYSGGKKSKERLSVLLCANLDGSDKQPSLVIGKYQNPRAFKNVKNLPVIYRSNKKAWMTSVIFVEHMKQLDKQFGQTNRKIAMVMDNCSAHPHQEMKDLKNIAVFFLPPCTTAVTQPMDGGIIQNFKTHYRRRLCLRRLSCMEGESAFHWNILDAVVAIRNAWSSVTSQVIRNCYRHCGFLRTSSDLNEIHEDNAEPHFGKFLQCAYKLFHLQSE
jgi:hypothetical protein